MARLLPLILALYSATVLTVNTQARVISLLEEDDMTSEFWVDIDCRHYKNRTAYLDAACNIPRRVPDEADLSGKTGLWGPCASTTCNIIYYASSLPPVLSVTVQGAVAGTASIKVAGQRSPIGNSLEDIGSLRNPATDIQWLDWTNDTRKFVINITVDVPDVTGFALVDNILIDLGPDVPEPTTTTPPPPKSLFVVDVKEDILSTTEFTEVTCNYAQHVDEFWTWGCPQEVPATDDTSFGYWAPCNAYQCHFIFSSGVGRPKAQRITVDGLFKIGGRISLSTKSRKFGAIYKTLYATEIRSEMTHIDFALDQDCDNDFYNISISAGGGPVLLDRLEVELFEEYSDTTTPSITDPPGVTGATGVTDATRTTGGIDIPDPIETSTQGAVSILASSVLIAISAYIALSTSSRQ